MGQAKRRGTFEQRKAAAVERDTPLIAERERLLEESERVRSEMFIRAGGWGLLGILAALNTHHYTTKRGR